jgi:hypothetical protein
MDLQSQNEGAGRGVLTVFFPDTRNLSRALQSHAMRHRDLNASQTLGLAP